MPNMVFVTIGKKFVGQANHGRSCNDEKLEKASAKPSHMANIKGPLSSQQKSSRVAKATISNRENVKGPLSSKQNSSRVATTAISNRNTHLNSSEVKRNARSISRPHVVPKPFRLRTEERSILRALNAGKSPKLVKRTSIDPLNFISCESSSVESLFEEGVGDYEFIMGSAICCTLDGSHVSETCDGATTQQNPIPIGIGEDEKLLVSEARSQILSMDGELDACTSATIQQSLIPTGIGEDERGLVSEAQSQMSSMDGDLDADSEKKELVIELENCLQMLSTNTDYLKWKASLFPETPASSATSSINGVTNSSGKSFSDNAKSATATMDDYVLTVGGTTPMARELDSMEIGFDILVLFEAQSQMSTMDGDLDACSGATTQQNPIPTGIGEDEKLLVSETQSQMSSMDGELDACTDAAIQQNPIPPGIGEDEKGLVSEAQSQMSSMDGDLDACTKDNEKKELVIELEKCLQMLSTNTDYLKWKASLFPETPASSATSSTNGVTNSSGKSFSDNAKSAKATKDDFVLKVGGTTTPARDLDSMETGIDGSRMKKLLLSDCGDAKKRLITMPIDLAQIVESSLTSLEESQCDQHSTEYIAGLRNSNSVNDSEYVKPMMTGSLSGNGYSNSIEKVPKSSKAAVGSLHEQSKEDLLSGTKPASSYKGLGDMTVTTKFKLPAIPENASVASLSYCPRNVSAPSTKSVANVYSLLSQLPPSSCQDRWEGDRDILDACLGTR